jgi:hypothetical protein
MEGIQVQVEHAEGVKCPRCWKWTGAGRFNFDGLCDACCGVLLEDYPEHEAVPGIHAAQQRQREKWLGVV